jgi:hypothetical protein
MVTLAVASLLLSLHIRDDAQLAARGGGTTRPRLESSPHIVPDVLRVCQELGLPVIVWCGGCLPSDTRGADAFFQAMGEARHVVLDELPAGKGNGPRIVFIAKDGKPRWVARSQLSKEFANRVMEEWRGETKPKREDNRVRE